MRNANAQRPHPIYYTIGVIQMSEQNKALDRRVYEAISNSNLDALDDLMAADIVDHELPPGLPPGVEGSKAFLGIFTSAFPDLKMAVEDQMAEGDRVVTRWTATGTHNGELMGIPATGRKVTVTGIDISRWSGGKQVEHWGQFDQMGMMQQLGVIPTPGEE
jgi:predicted ester cyclase